MEDSLSEVPSQINAFRQPTTPNPPRQSPGGGGGEPRSPPRGERSGDRGSPRGERTGDRAVRPWQK